jgi:hypothetical protein
MNVLRAKISIKNEPKKKHYKRRDSGGESLNKPEQIVSKIQKKFALLFSIR